MRFLLTKHTKNNTDIKSKGIRALVLCFYFNLLSRKEIIMNKKEQHKKFPKNNSKISVNCDVGNFIEIGSLSFKSDLILILY